MSIFIKILQKRKVFIFITICSSLITAAATLWWNSQLSIIINEVSMGAAPAGKIMQKALFTILLIAVFSFIKSSLAGYTCESMTHDLRMGYARYFLLLSYEEIETVNAGEELSGLQNEIANVSDYLNSSLFSLFDDSIRFLITFIWLFFMNPLLTVIVNIPVFIIVLYVFWSSKIISIATECSQTSKEEMNQYIDTLVTLFPIIRLYDAWHLTQDKYIHAVKKWESYGIRLERTKAKLMSLSALLSSLPLMILFLVGGRMTIYGTLTLGTLYIFLNLSGNVSGVLMNMPGHIAAFRQFSANLKRLGPHIIQEGKGE